MWIVLRALRRPYTFVVLAVGIVLIGVLTISRIATDIYPQIDIPVVAAIWTYNGLPPQEMEGRITSMFERAVTTTVSGIEHLESQSLSGVAVVKVYLQPGTSVTAGVTQVAAAAQPILRMLPPGTAPPNIIEYSASDTAILQLDRKSTRLNSSHGRTSHMSTRTLHDALPILTGIEPLESQSLSGVAVVKVYLQPGTSVTAGVTQVAAAAQPILRMLPPGTAPPNIIEYSASDSAILQLVISSPTLAEQQIYDLSTNFLRPRLAT